MTFFWEYPISGDTKEHAAAGVGPATDYETPMNTVINAPLAGHLSPYYTGTGGNSLKLAGEKFTYYGQHLAKLPTAGDVSWRQDIARSGNSGSSTTGPHHHSYIVINATGQRISFSEWLRDYVRAAPSAPTTPQPPVAQAPKHLLLGNEHWYWYYTADDVNYGGRAQGKRAGQIMLTGTYPILSIAGNGAIQVLSNSMGRVWVSGKAANKIR